MGYDAASFCRERFEMLSTGKLSLPRFARSCLAVKFWILFAICAVGQAAEQVPRSPGSSVGQALAADLTWPEPLRDQRFGHMDQVFPVHVVRRGRTVRRLHRGKPLAIPEAEVQDYMAREHLAGVLVLHNGRIRLERYGLGAVASTRWTGFSMTKAITDTLVGVALHAGKIRSLQDPMTHYLPELRGTAYDGVTVRQVMTMTSGVRWHEDYTSRDADNVRLYTAPVRSGQNPTLSYMRTLPRGATPGLVWNYSTGETDLLGVLLRRVTGRSLAAQLSTAIWQHAGMGRDATWIATAEGPEGEEFGGSGLSATLRDWGRLGQWMLGGGQGALNEGWMEEATCTQVHAGQTAYGYGWWPQKDTSGQFDGSFAALGIFGQSMRIDPRRRLVVVTLGDWEQATGAAHSAERAAFWQKVNAAVDAEKHPHPD